MERMGRPHEGGGQVRVGKPIKNLENVANGKKESKKKKGEGTFKGAKKLIRSQSGKGGQRIPRTKKMKLQKEGWKK